MRRRERESPPPTRTHQPYARDQCYTGLAKCVVDIREVGPLLHAGTRAINRAFRLEFNSTFRITHCDLVILGL